MRILAAHSHRLHHQALKVGEIRKLRALGKDLHRGMGPCWNPLGQVLKHQQKLHAGTFFLN